VRVESQGPQGPADLVVKRKVKHGVTVAVFQNSQAEDHHADQARARASSQPQRAFTWNGRKTPEQDGALRAGVYFVRFRVTDAKGKRLRAASCSPSGNTAAGHQEGQVRPREPLLAAGSVAVDLSASVQIWPPPSPMC
jgi:hypothetical protein